MLLVCLIPTTIPNVTLIGSLSICIKHLAGLCMLDSGWLSRQFCMIISPFYIPSVLPGLEDRFCALPF